MDIKKKRRNLIIGFVVFGLISFALLLAMDVKNDLTAIAALFSIVPGICHFYFTSVLKWNNFFSGVMAVIVQIVVYFFLGCICARLVYPNKKTPPESDN